jgi:hypothetical protein
MNTQEPISEKRTTRVYTKLKFVKSDVSGATVSFVSQNPKTGRICGVRQDSSYPKKICMVDKAIAGQIIMNALYDCTLIPMTDKNGYVVISAEPVQFKATVETTYIKNNVYLVEVKFGNKVIRFDPFNGRKESVKSFQACKAVLEKRIDVKDIIQVVDDFEKAAEKVMTLMEMDRFRGRKL